MTKKIKITINAPIIRNQVPYRDRQTNLRRSVEIWIWKGRLIKARFNRVETTFDDIILGNSRLMHTSLDDSSSPQYLPWTGYQWWNYNIYDTPLVIMKTRVKKFAV